MAEIGNRFALLVIDEAHHFGSGMRDEALEMCTAAARLGLTATPPRAGPAAAHLADLVGPVVFELRVSDLTGTFLAPFDHVIFNLGLTVDERRSYEADLALYRPLVREFFRAHPTARWSDFVRTVSSSDEGRRALAAFRRARSSLAYTEAKHRTVGMLLERHAGGRTLLFTSDNATAYAVAREHLVMPITSDIGRAERAAALEMFRRGELDALVSARVLNEGLDVPDADVAVIVGGALGEREHVQRVGRVLRPRPEKRAIVYELVCAETSEVERSRRHREGLRGGAAHGMPRAR
jgi:superfamily II DNA or RNA helicase